jgi:thiol-disulfide isomerase/thioredoxin
MNPLRILYIAIAGLLIGAGIGVGLKVTEQPAPQATASPVTPTAALAEQVPDFSYPDLEGNLRHGKEWQAKILVLNFWAAWCPPCREETPDFVELQEKYVDDNVKFVGIAIDDPEPVQDFADTYGVNYPILLGDIKAVTLSRELGNRFEGLPFTVVAEPGGRVLLRHAGGLSREQLEPVLLEAIEKSRRTHEQVARI